MIVCGIDEAGRGPLAGPVCAAAVILGGGFPLEILGDSKKLSPAKREKARGVICSSAAAWGVGWASHAEIDEINILRASLLAMRRAFEQLLPDGNARNGGAWPPAITGESAFGSPLAAADFPPGLTAVVDGLYCPDIAVPCEGMVKADAKVPEVMAASILAKTARDRLMEHYDKLYPGYGYAKHKGYPTRSHRELVLRLGPSPVQRMSFRVALN